MDADVRARLRKLPKIDAVLARPEVAAIAAPRWAVVEAIRCEVDALRSSILGANGGHGGGPEEYRDSNRDHEPAPPVATDDDSLAISTEVIERRVAALVAPSLCRVINATGVVLHTNLGRAPLGDDVMARTKELATGYCNLEYDIDAGRRGSRHGHLTDLITQLTGAEDAAVVNNNAAAVMLSLSALAHDREVIVSRGELVEIGGSFRVPDVMRLSGAHLIEVGTTNKTRAADYRDALTERTGMLLKVHRSNFAIVGFTEEASCAELASIGREHGVVSMMDQGCGALIAGHEAAARGLAHEPSVAETVASGIDLVCFSGDKLLGGPQAGIVCGSREHITRIRKHPLMRAMRPDKLTICALAATLEMYRDHRAYEVPGVGMLTEPAGSIRERADAVMGRLGDGVAVDVKVVSCESRVGGGAMPLVAMPSWGIGVRPRSGAEGDDRGDGGAAKLERALRRNTPAVIGRMVEDQLVLDMRTVRDHELDVVVDALRRLA